LATVEEVFKEQSKRNVEMLQERKIKPYKGDSGGVLPLGLSYLMPLARYVVPLLMHMERQAY